MINSLYIHIPFCDHICAYCDFPKQLIQYSKTEEYLNALIDEINELKIPDDQLRTIYIGGGTPTSLSLSQLEILLFYLKSHFKKLDEFTIEANPEGLNFEKLQLIKQSGINRISLGVQSSSNRILEKLGRHHFRKDVVNAVDMIKKIGIYNFNLDFIYGLENTSINDVKNDLEFALSLQPKHLSFYSLQIEPNTYFYINKTNTVSDDELADIYAYISKTLEENSFVHYEISNFALPGFESKHNLTYWHDQQYYAVGLGASSYVGNKRETNTLSMKKYLEKKLDKKTEFISKKDEEFEFIMLNLRLKEGFSLSEYFDRFNIDFLQKYRDKIAKEKEYLIIKNGRVSVKPSYFYILDTIFLNLIS